MCESKKNRDVAAQIFCECGGTWSLIDRGLRDYGSRIEGLRGSRITRVVRTRGVLYFIYGSHGLPHLYYFLMRIVMAGAIRDRNTLTGSIAVWLPPFSNTAEGAAIKNVKQLHEVADAVPR